MALRTRTGLALAAAAIVIAGGATAAVALPGGGPRPAPPPAATPAALAGSFLQRYMASDGRIVRIDQGRDTVSEGQAYGMLLAAAVGDRRDFARIWSWTAAHLLQPDGLLAWRWAHGAIASREPASDGDLGTAAALVMASRRFGDPAYLGDARRIASAMAAREVAPGPGGPTLVAGPWALSPVEYVDPSYLAPAELDQLAAAFGAPWTAVAANAEAQLEALTSNGDLPPDWAVIGSDHRIHPSAPPGSAGGAVLFGFDAVRTPIWMATSCNAQLRSAAAGLGPAIGRGGGQVGLNLGGNPDPGTAAPVGLLAEAAVDFAAGRSGPAWTLVARADRANQADPTYYSSAWLALTALGFTHALEACR